MHYRTAAIDWEIETPNDFLAQFPAAAVIRLETPDFNLDDYVQHGQLTVLVPAAPQGVGETFAP
jgi:hypothetical protein